jgi:GT2 family glycosyltransferase
MFSNNQLILKTKKSLFRFFDKPIKKPLEEKSKVSIIIITYNALNYIKTCFESLKKTNYKNYEIIVVDNGSVGEIKKYLSHLKKKREINKLFFSRENTFWSGGNNLGVDMCSKHSDFFLFLNPDVEIKDGDWLQNLVSLCPKNGLISYGTAKFSYPDGFCLMVQKDVFRHVGGFNANIPMWGSELEFALRAVKKGYTLRTVVNYLKYIVHFGKQSKNDKNSKLYEFDEIDSYIREINQYEHKLNFILALRNLFLVSDKYLIYIYIFLSKFKTLIKTIQ